MNAVRYSRESQNITITAGNRHTFRLKSDWFFIHRLQANTEAGDDVEIQLSVNSRATAPVSRGEPGGGVIPGTGEIETLEFYNNTGAPVFIRIVYGLGIRPYSPETRLSAGSSIALDAETVSDLIDAKELEPVWDILTNQSQTYPAMKAINIENFGPGLVSVTLPSGVKTLDVNTSKYWSIENDSDYLSDITVTVPNGTEAEVTGLQLA